MFQRIKSALVIFSVFVILTGLGYPLIITGTAQVLFPTAIQWKPVIYQEFHSHWICADRTIVYRTKLFLGSTFCYERGTI